MHDVIYASATALAQAIRAKEISSAEAVRASLQRIEAVNPALNAVVQLRAEAALAEASAADAALARGEILGPLHGVPMTIKDSLDTAGVITTGGTTGRASFVPEQDATVVARLRTAGAILLGKTNTPELTLWGETDNLVYGRTNNPYDLARTSGGSSGGAAATIAAGGSPLDIGSDTRGSIRLPAHFTGIAGIKPTSGRVPRTGHIVPWGLGAVDALTQLGPLARYVEDLVLTLPILAGVDWSDPAIAPMPLGDPQAVPLQGLRVAMYTDNGILAATPETVAAVHRAATALTEAGAQVHDDRPPLLERAEALYNILSDADGRAWVRRLLQRAGTTVVHPRLQQRLEEARPLSVGDFTALLEEVDRCRSALLGFLQPYDLILCPVCAFPAPQEGSWVVRDFRFHTGEVLPELHLYYTTVGVATGEPVLILHGTTGSGTGMLNPRFADELFGPGQPLDASRYYLILPDAIGTGKSSKPSDGLRTSFPRYNYDDMVDARYRLVTEHLGVRHLRLVLGNSMGGMHTWLWAQKYPDFMDVAVPMASLPTEMAGRNWMTRRLIIDSIRNDPEWMHGNYTTQPRSLQFASVFYGIATNGGNQALYKATPTREQADQLLNERLSAPFRGDANDHLYQWEASRDYNASSALERIQAALLAINSADDERNPPELGLLDREIKRVKHGRVLLIPGSDETAGHGTTARAKFWKQDVAELLQSAPRRAK